MDLELNSNLKAQLRELQMSAAKEVNVGDFKGPSGCVCYGSHLIWIIHLLMDPSFKPNLQGKSSRPVVLVARTRFADAETEGKVEESVPVRNSSIGS